MTEIELLHKVGLKIKKISGTKNMSQKKLAEECRFEKANMSRIESGQTNATMLTLHKISSALDVSVAELFVD